MKTTNHILLIVAGFILLTGVLIAQPTVDGQFVVVTNNGTTYSVKIQLKASVATGLGTTTLQFTFNTSNLTFPASPVASTDYVYSAFSGGSYASTVTRPLANTVSINISWNGVDNTGTLVNTTFTDVVTINFGVSNSAGNSNLTWTLEEVFDDDNITLWTNGTFTNENTTPLPVQLVSFTASASLRNAELHWSTATEVRNYGFEIERRRVEDGLHLQGAHLAWTKIGFVQGAGTSNVPRDYTYSDKGLAPGRYAYRIKQIDNDGTFEYFNSAEVEIGKAPKTLALEPNYPNPFNPSTKIEFTLPENGRASLKIYNTVGQEVATLFNEEGTAGRLYQVTFDGSQFSSGVYYYTLDFNNQRIVKKMLLVK